MDESFLNDLLECSVCLEQLDSTSKVLPCQHTFCKRCLEDIVGCHKELRCPECRILVETRIDDLPCNILLIRLLEGIKSTAALKNPPAVTTFTQAESMALQSQKAAFSANHWQHSQPTDLRTHIKQVIQPLPCAKALYSYEAKRLGDLSFKKGDMIILRKRIDQNWYEGELNGKPGYLPATHIQVIVPLHFPLPQAKALYDFHANNKDDKDCLTFMKGETVTLIRKVDANWAEGKIGERAGIFPVSFVELNTAAKALMKLSNQVTRASPSMSSCEVQPVEPVVPISASSSVVQPSTLPPVSSPSLALSTTNSPCLSSPIFSSVAMNLHGPFTSGSWQTPVSLSSIAGCHSTSSQREHPGYIKHSPSVSSSFRESPGHQSFPLSQPSAFQREQNLAILNSSSICSTTQPFSPIGYSSNYKRDHPIHVSPLSISYPDSNSQPFSQASAHINNYHREQNIPSLQASAMSVGAKDLSSHHFTPISAHSDGYHSISRLSPATLSSYDAIPAPDGFSQMPVHQSSYSDDHSKVLSLDGAASSETENSAVSLPADTNLETEDEHISSLSDSCRIKSRENSPAAQMFSPVSSATGGIEKEKERSSPLLSNVVPSADEVTSVLSGSQREPTPTPQTFPTNLPDDVSVAQSYPKEKTVLGSNHQILQNIDLQSFPTPASLVSSRSQVLYNPDTSPVGATSPTSMIMQSSSEIQSPEWEDQSEVVNLEPHEEVELDHQSVLPCSQELNDASSPVANVSRMPESNGMLSAQLYYLALYNYQPQKKDELELKRGELYIVNEKCQDGWFKGTSVKTGHSGVFPGNYVQIAKLSVVQSPLHGVSPTLTNNRPLSSSALSGSQSNIQAVSNHKHLCATSVKNTGNATYGQVITDRTLPPNSVSIAVSGSTQPSFYSTEYISIKQNGSSDSSFGNGMGISEKIQSVSSASQLPWTTRSPVLIAGGPVGVIQKVEVISKPNTNMQLRSVQRPVQGLSGSASSSPLLPETSLKTVSNNGSTDCLSSMGQLYVTQAPGSLDSQGWPGCSQARRISRHSPLHSQSVLPSSSSSSGTVVGLSATVANLPVSSSSQNRTDKPKERKEKERVSLMKRLTKKKSKSPPPSTYSADGSSLAESSSSQSCLPLVHVRSVSCPSEALGSQSALHKKSCSLDSNASGVPRLSSRAKQPVPLIKERFRCIVPYPPNSDYELELKIGDIVFVHKKREDGWYKGTLQRTGRTGLFPASFVESI